MKTLVIASILLVALSGCWDAEQKKKSDDFMSNLTKCENDCRITEPFLGGGKKGEGDGR
ncbi:hypothetical protein IGS68_34860 (plasmid) [Skermanella sp. TT6]|uniref:Lipoprotein n=1 Tax=Skermanella cutis TaxID=2775420 RepID=A0ABX7BLT8_9PROT|nr:hypothetical protein [Skermanella sp. TT6]QQP93962.1 hypothetical protein IGS68_34860 [Skermanella sp. TT6]